MSQKASTKCKESCCIHLTDKSKSPMQILIIMLYGSYLARTVVADMKLIYRPENTVVQFFLSISCALDLIIGFVINKILLCCLFPFLMLLIIS